MGTCHIDRERGEDTKMAEESSSSSRPGARVPPSLVSTHFILLPQKPCLPSTSKPLHNHRQHWKSYHQQPSLRFVVFEMLFKALSRQPGMYIGASFRARPFLSCQLSQNPCKLWGGRNTRHMVVLPLPGPQRLKHNSDP